MARKIQEVKAVTAQTETKQFGKKKDSAVDYQWWEKTDDEIFQHIVGTVRRLEDLQRYREYLYYDYYRFYSNYDIKNFAAGNYARPVHTAPTTRMVVNVIKSVIDTLAAKIAQARPRPLFLTERGTYTQQRKAQLLTQYMDGAFDDLKLYQTGQQIFVDSAIFGTGAAKFYQDENGVHVDRLLPHELIIDDREAVYGYPRQLHIRRDVSKDVLCQKFPDKQDLIMSAPPIQDAGQTLSNSNTVVFESWHLSSGPGATDGKHTMVIVNGTLLVEEYTDTEFPILVMRWTPSPLGFFGIGIPDELGPLQIELEELYRVIHESQQLVVGPWVIIDGQANVPTAHFTDEIGRVIKPGVGGIDSIRFETPQAVQPEVYTWAGKIEQMMYALSGVSQLSAQGVKPAGVDAAIAMRTLQDIESDRFQLVSQRYEDWYMDCAKKIIKLTREHVEEFSENPQVKVKGKGFMKKIKWSQVDMDEDEYVMSVFPTSLLPKTPAGRLSTIQELIQAKLIDSPEQGRELLDVPDLEGAMDLMNAAVDDAKYIIECLTDKGKYIAPEPFMNLQLTIQMMQSAYLRASVDGLPEDRLDLMRTWISDAQAMMQMANSAMAGGSNGQPGLPAGQPAAVPTPPPQAPLLPQQAPGGQQ